MKRLRSGRIVLDTDTRAAVAQLAADVGCTEAQAISRAVALAMQLRALAWLGSPLAPEKTP